MSVNGLERITDKILADAREQAKLILEQARTDCEGITADYTARAEEIRERLSREAEEKASAFVARTKASAAMKRNELLLEQQGALVDGVFEDAMKQTMALESEKYAELLGGLLAAAVLDFCRTEAENRALYGDEEEAEEAVFEVILNKKDRESCGEAVLASARKKLAGKVPAEVLDSMMLSRQMRKMAGGVILCYGAVECNCSFEMLFAQLRRELEGEVSRALFDFRGNGI